LPGPGLVPGGGVVRSLLRQLTCRLYYS
jgi:hypothetical protein